MHMPLIVPNASALMNDWICTKRASAPATRQSPAPLVFTMLAGMAGRCCVMTLMPAVPRLQTAAPWDPKVNMTCLTPACIQNLSCVKGLCMSMRWNMNRYTAATRQQLAPGVQSSVPPEAMQYMQACSLTLCTQHLQSQHLLGGNGHAANAECERPKVKECCCRPTDQCNATKHRVLCC